MKYMHDFDYIFRLLNAFPGKVSYLHDEKLLYYRIHGKNTLFSGAISAREEGKILARKYTLEKIPKKLRPIVKEGIKRLLTLEHELQRERFLKNKKGLY